MTIATPRVTLAALLLPAPCATLSADTTTVPFTVIARAGDPAPGLNPPGNFGTFSGALSLSHIANYVPGLTPAAGPGVRFYGNTNAAAGEFLWRPGIGLSLIYQPGVTPAPSPYAPGSTISSMTGQGLLLPGGFHPFIAPVPQLFGSHALFFADPASPTIAFLLRSGDVAPTPLGFQISTIQGSTLSACGSGFALAIDLQDFVNFTGNVNALYTVDLSNPASPVITDRARGRQPFAPPNVIISDPDISRGIAVNAARQFAFATTLFGTGVNASNNRILLRDDPSLGLQVYAREGDPAPGFPGASFADDETGGPYLLTINNAGNGAFVWRTGPALGQGGVWAGAPGSLALIAREGDPAPDGPAGSTIGTLAQAFITPNDRVVFHAQIRSSGGASLGQGLWMTRPLAAGAAPRLLTRVNAAAPGMPAGVNILSVPFGAFGPLPLYMNARGETAFYARLSGAGVASNNDFVMYVGAPGRLTPVLRTGWTLELAPGVTKTVSSIQDGGTDRGAGTQDGKPNIINDLGQLFLRVAFTDNSNALLLLQLPHPCAGDANGDGVIDFIDLNVILSAFGTTGPPGFPGDFNNDGVVDFLDLNSVLSFFGSAC